MSQSSSDWCRQLWLRAWGMNMTHILNHQPETGEVQHTQSGPQAGKTPHAQAGAEGVGVENLGGWGQVWS